MRRVPLVVFAVAVLAGCGGAKPKSEQSPPPLPWYFRAPQVELGFARSLTPLGGGYKLRLDLYLLFGPDKTGIAACVDNHECPRGQKGFLDDSYEHDLNYVVTYYVPPTTPVTLVGDQTYPQVTARYFYEYLHGRNPRHLVIQSQPRPSSLGEFGFYVQISDAQSPGEGFERVLRMGQVYHP